MDPTNYWGYLNPVQPVTAGIDALQQQQAQSAQRALASNQIQQQLRQQSLQQAALNDALTNPSPQAYANYALVNPGAVAGVKQAYDSLDEQTQRQSLQDVTAFHNYLDANRPDDAIGVLQKHIDAAKKSRQDTTAYDALKNLAQTDPRQAQVMAGTILSTIGGADKMATAYSTMGKEGREQAAFPLDQAGKVADINLKTAQAGAAQNDTDVNPVTGAYYNKKAPPPAAALTSNNGALDNVVQQLIQSESGGNATAKNPNSTATGAGQFLSGTWAPLIAKLHPDLVAGKSPQQVLDLRNNPQLAAEATAAYAQDNAQALGSAGLPVNGASIAMAHRLGPGDAQAVLKAQADTPLSQVLSADVIKANPQYAKMTAGQLGQQLASKFGTTAIDANPGDPNATGEDYLRSLPPERGRMIKAIADGDLALSSVGGRSGPQKQLLAQQVLQYDPEASEINLAARRKTRLDFTAGTQGQSIVQANTIGGHLAALDALATGLNNGPIPVFNAISQKVQPALGDAAKQKAVTAFNTLLSTAAPELVKFYRANGGAESDVKEFRKQLDPSNPQLHTAISEIAGAVLSKIGALNDSYNTGMGKVSGALNLPNINHNAIGRLQQLAGGSTFGDQSGQPQGAAAPVATNAQGQRVVFDAASRTWKPG